VSVRAVIFDFNGTISDDEPVLDELFRAMAAGLGAPLTSADYYRDLAGLSDPEIVDRILARSGVTPTAAERERLLRDKVARYKAIVARTPTVTDAVAAFVRATAQRVPIAIASGAVREEVEHVLGLAGLADEFAAVVCADDVVRGKPDPEGYLRALAALNAAGDTRPDVTAAEVLVCEDADPGIQAAKAAGMRCLALRNPAYTGRTVAADVVLDRLDPADVDRLLGM
jgi:HAD superfamily hydrolase (TIGR01509 family)